MSDVNRRERDQQDECTEVLATAESAGFVSGLREVLNACVFEARVEDGDPFNAGWNAALKAIDSFTTRCLKAEGAERHSLGFGSQAELDAAAGLLTVARAWSTGEDTRDDVLRAARKYFDAHVAATSAPCASDEGAREVGIFLPKCPRCEMIGGSHTEICAALPADTPSSRPAEEHPSVRLIQMQAYRAIVAAVVHKAGGAVRLTRDDILASDRLTLHRIDEPDGTIEWRCSANDTPRKDKRGA